MNAQKRIVKKAAKKAAKKTAKKTAKRASGPASAARSSAAPTSVARKSTPRPSTTRKSAAGATGGVVLLVATRKGAWLLHGDAARRTWRADGPHFLGHIVNHVVLDPRSRTNGGRTLLAAAKTGHLGPTVFRSTDLGKTWNEATQPPAFAKKADGSGRSVDHTFWLTPGHASQPGVWWAGTSPQGLFRSDDDGITWTSASPINDDPQYIKWMGTVQDGTPDGPKMHSIIVDPRATRSTCTSA
ncbi:MAG: glycoside hydrolase [Burkholderiaceae bacterium]|nr:glycoside hydrolase [Burkholderiaceae bacterium]